MSFKPLLAVQSKDYTKINYPVLVSKKIDGIRALVIDGVIVSRNLKPIRNKYVQSILGKNFLNGLDGELIVGEPNGSMVYRRTSSGVMSEDGEPDFTFWVFDNFLDTQPFGLRLKELQEVVDNLPDMYKKHIKVLPHVVIEDAVELVNNDKQWLLDGYEGSMVRSVIGHYKHGRSTEKEGILLKIKQFVDMEAKIIGFKERMHNANEAKTDALGHTERSMHQENMIGRGDLGAVEVEYLHKSNDEFRKEGLLEDGKVPTVGSGFNDKDRTEIWNNKEQYLGKIITVKCFEYGDYGVPRFPIFKGFRDTADMSE